MDEGKRYVYAVAYFIFFFIVTLTLLNFSDVLSNTFKGTMTVGVVGLAAVLLLLIYPALYQYKKVSKKLLYIILYSSSAVLLAFFIMMIIKTV
jgi:hypothetical protein